MTEAEIHELAEREPEAFDLLESQSTPRRTSPERAPAPIREASPNPPPSLDASPSHEASPSHDAVPPPKAQSPAPSPASSPAARRTPRIDPALRDNPAAVRASVDRNLGRGMRSKSRIPVEALASVLRDGDDIETVHHHLREEQAFLAKVGSNMSFKKALEKHGAAANDSCEKEITQMLEKDIFRPVYTFLRDMLEPTLAMNACSSRR